MAYIGAGAWFYTGPETVRPPARYRRARELRDEAAAARGARTAPGGRARRHVRPRRRRRREAPPRPGPSPPDPIRPDPIQHGPPRPSPIQSDPHSPIRLGPVAFRLRRKPPPREKLTGLHR